MRLRTVDLYDIAVGTAELGSQLVYDGRMPNLDELGVAHQQLQTALAILRLAVRERLIEEREAGATWQQLQARSGYASVTSVRAAVLTDVRDQLREGERRRRSERADRADAAFLHELEQDAL